MKKFLLIAAIIGILTACSKRATVGGNATVIQFGTSYGFCIGNSCITNYRLSTDGKLIKTTSSPTGANSVTTIVTDATQLSQADRVFRQAPEGLMAITKDTSFGCPDCADQGATVVRVRNTKAKDDTVTIRFDNFLDGNPTEFRTFVELIKETTFKLKALPNN